MQASGFSSAVNALATISAGLGCFCIPFNTPQQPPQQQQRTAISCELLGCRTSRRVSDGALQGPEDLHLRRQAVVVRGWAGSWTRLDLFLVDGEAPIGALAGKVGALITGKREVPRRALPTRSRKPPQVPCFGGGGAGMSVLKMSWATFHLPPTFFQTTTYLPLSLTGLPSGPFNESW
jgi:hypothetical protein